MNSRPNTYISEDTADVIAKLAEKDDLVERAEAALEGVTDGPWTEHDKGRHPNAYVCGATENYEHGDDQPVVAYIVGINVEANRRFIAFTRQWVPEAVAHIVALTKQSAKQKAESLEFKAKADERAEILVKELVLVGSSLTATEDEVTALRKRVAQLEGALGFYAKWPNPDGVDDYGIHDDCGRTARAALNYGDKHE